jgi:nucleotide-binding universal stress UspA family protein
MYKRILCPIDGSETSKRGMLEAIGLAKDQTALLRLVHIVDTYVPLIDDVGSLIPVDMTDVLEKNAEELIEPAKNTAKNAGVEVDAKIIEMLGGRASEEIIKHAKEWSADIIVMGTHGLRGFNRVVMGSDAENVVRTSAIPVLLVNSSDKQTIKD